MAGLYAAQARVLIELRGRYPDDDSDDEDDLDEARTARISEQSPHIDR
jgi:hypothetical protein